MEVEILVLCDSAQNYQDKLVVVGAFNTIYAESCPFVHPAFSLACRLSFSKTDKSGEKTIKIAFLNEKNETFMDDAITIPIPDNSIDDSHVVNFVGGYHSIRFESFGKYLLQITIDDFYRELPLYIKPKA